MQVKSDWKNPKKGAITFRFRLGSQIVVMVFTLNLRTQIITSLATN